MRNKAAYPGTRTWRELREACLERANKQCEFIHKNGKRCARYDGELRTSRSTRRKYIVYLHAAHSANACPDDPNPELICLCPAHHLKMDRALEAQDRISQRRRGYRITTTDSLLVEIREAGIEIEEQSDGYHWSLSSLGLGGHATTAARAAGCALYQLRLSLEKAKQTRTHALSIPTDRSLSMTTIPTTTTQQIHPTNQSALELRTRRTVIAQIGCAPDSTFEWASRQAITETSEAKMVLSLCPDASPDLHFAAIIAADEIQVLNLAGHVDADTVRELCVAYNAGKPITWMEDWPMYCPACQCSGPEAEHFFHNALSLRNLNELFDALSQEQLIYLDGQLADWYGQVVLVVMMPDGYPALQVELSCACGHWTRTAYAVSGEYGAWTTLLEADGSFLLDLCDADARAQALICPECATLQANTVTEEVA